jgi:hypothetical protein
MSLHLSEGFIPSAEWLSQNDSQLCPGCANAIVSLLGRCSDCSAHVSDSSSNISVGPDGGLSDSASDLSDGEKFEVREILDRRKSAGLVEYLVAWEGYSASANSWEPARSLSGARDAIVKFNSSSKDAKGSSMTIPRATGIPQLKRNNIVQVSLGTSRSALDAWLPVSSPTLPNSSSGMGESKQSKAAIVPANTQNSLLQEGLDFAVLGERVLVSPSPLPPCLFLFMRIAL